MKVKKLAVLLVTVALSVAFARVGPHVNFLW